MSNERGVAPAMDYTHALRITVARTEGGELQIRGVQRAAMRVPASPVEPPQIKQTGYWLEVRNAAGDLLYHYPIHDPLRQHTESFGVGPSDRMRRHISLTARAQFAVLVPDIPGAVSFLLSGPPLEHDVAPTQEAESRRQRNELTPSVPLVERNFTELRGMALTPGRGDKP